jgi:hypothetical protein
MRRRKSRRQCNEWPVMKEMCTTCPFGNKGDRHTREVVTSQVVQLRSSQICHHPALTGREETHLCRGARDLQLRIMTGLGILPEPTDEAFQTKWKQLKEEHGRADRSAEPE